jgi:hypothetical protein
MLGALREENATVGKLGIGNKERVEGIDLFKIKSILYAP